MTEFKTGKETSKILGVHQRTLYLWDKKKKIETIRTPSGKRLYNVNKFLNKLKQEQKKDEITKENKKQIIYARVSSLQQKDDLKR